MCVCVCGGDPWIKMLKKKKGSMAANYGLFITTIRSRGTDQQIATFVKRAYRFGVVGKKKIRKYFSVLSFSRGRGREGAAFSRCSNSFLVFYYFFLIVFFYIVLVLMTKDAKNKLLVSFSFFFFG